MSIALIQSLQSLAQAGLAYSRDSFDRQRFDAIQNIAVELLAAEANLKKEKAESIIFDEVGYRTPKVDVRGAVFQEAKLLLVRERSDGLWEETGLETWAPKAGRLARHAKARAEAVLPQL